MMDWAQRLHFFFFLISVDSKDGERTFSKVVVSWKDSSWRSTGRFVGQTYARLDCTDKR